jgi:hypothetical protein
MPRSLGFIVFLLLGTRALGHEVTVHQRLSAVAAKQSENMQGFLNDFGISTLEPFDGAPATVYELVQSEMGDTSAYDMEIRRLDWIPAHLLRAGSITEDSSEGHVATGRWCNHFYMPSAEGGQAYNVSGIPLCGTDALSWALNAGDNLYSWERAYDDLYAGLTAQEPDDRKRALARCFYDLGHVIHLVQDLSQPSHTRNDGHGCIGGVTHGIACAVPVIGQPFCLHGPLACSSFEKYFHAGHNRNLAVTLGGRSADAKRYSTRSEYFTGLAGFSAGQFYSDETIGEIASFYRLLPSYPPIVYLPVGENPYFVNSNLPDGHDRIAVASLFIEDWDLDDDLEPELAARVTIDDPAVMLDYGYNLFPEAVANSAGLLDHFFRARLAISIEEIESFDAERDAITYRIENISEVLGGDAESVTLTEFYEAAECIAKSPGFQLRAEYADGRTYP